MATAKTKTTPKQSLASQTLDFITGSAEGVTAIQIATHLNLITDKMEKMDRASALKKVRVLARKAVGGPASSRDGRSAIYKVG